MRLSPLPIIMYNVPGRYGAKCNCLEPTADRHTNENIFWHARSQAAILTLCSRSSKNKLQDYFMVHQRDDPITLQDDSPAGPKVLISLCFKTAYTRLNYPYGRYFVTAGRDFNMANHIHYKYIRYALASMFCRLRPSGVKAYLS